MSSDAYTLLDGEWPILEQAPPIPDHIMQKFSSNCSGLAITSNLAYFSLGLFYIDVDLVEPHPTQRQINLKHVGDLVNDFETGGISRLENPGVVIGLGLGWNLMKNYTPDKYKITTTCTHLSHLSSTSGGPIGQVIRGGHRTEAIRQFSKLPENSEERYWLYEVLVPGKIPRVLCY
jgi:hypothetical protein